MLNFCSASLPPVTEFMCDQRFQRFQAGGNTCDFFKNSKIKDYKDMWYFMNNTPNVLTDTIEDGITKVKKEATHI